MDSILNTIKKMVLGTMPDNSDNPEENAAFNTDIIVNINTAFSILTQLGAGPKDGFFIVDDSTTWTDYIADTKAVEMVKMYVYLKVRLGFDPPASSSGVELMKEQAKEYEWRICEAYAHQNS